MTTISNKAIMQNRMHAAYFLSEKLMAYLDSDAVVIAIPRGGVPVGYHLANLLHLSFEIALCEKIKDPGSQRKTIGSVSMDDAVVHEGCRSVPQDYVYHQIQLLQHTLASKYEYYSAGKKPISLKLRTVIIVDDMLKTGGTMKASLKSIKRQNPKKIIVAVPVASLSAARLISKEVDNFVSLKLDSDMEGMKEFYRDLPEVKDEEVRELFANYKIDKQTMHLA